LHRTFYGYSEATADFKEFLRLLGSHGVECLLVGGYAVSFYGYPRATNDLTVWVKISAANARAITDPLREFGFGGESLQPRYLWHKDSVIRMGVPPMRLEILTSISGVQLDECYAEREVFACRRVASSRDQPFAGVRKTAAGRAKDLADLDNLPN
jgi:hypothetical protein